MADDSSEDIAGALAPILKLSQAEISFTAPFGKSPEQKVLLLNPSDDAVAFKIRTTAPKRYCVRPNIGIVPAKDKVEVQVVLSVSKDPITDMNQRDKFQILSTVVKDAVKASTAQHDPTSVRDMFDKGANVPTMKQKLRCSFKSSSGSAVNNTHTTAASQASIAASKQKPTSKVVGFEGSNASSASETGLENAHAVAHSKSEAAAASSDSIKDRYSSTLTEALPAESNLTLRQRSVDSSSICCQKPTWRGD